MTPSRRARLASLSLLGVLTVGASVFWVAASAQAHNYIVSSTPAEGATIATLPASFGVTTNDNLLSLGGATGGFALQVKDSAGLFYEDGCITVAGPTMSTSAVLGAPGPYTVLWQLVSIDGHSVSGSYDFTWAPAAGQTTATGTSAAPVCGQAASPSASTPSQPGTTTEPGTPSQSALPPEADPSSTGSGQDDGAGTILGIGGGVVGLAAIVVAAIVLVGRRADKRAAATKRD